MMGTRTGDLDTGVAFYLLQSQKLSPKEFSHLLNHESGLLGISETSADMRALMNDEYSDSRTAEAIELFCYLPKKWIGSFAAALGGCMYWCFQKALVSTLRKYEVKYMMYLSF